MHSCIHTLQIALLIPGIVAHGFSKGFPAGPLQASDRHTLLARHSMQGLSSAMVDLDPPGSHEWIDRRMDTSIDGQVNGGECLNEQTNERTNE